MDLSTTVLHTTSFLIAKLTACGLSFDTVTILYICFKDRKQSLKINNICSWFQTILSGLPQRFILGPVLFDIFFNDPFLRLKHSNFHNFVDNNNIAVTCNNMKDLLRTLE